MTIKCTECGEEKPPEAFSWRKKNVRRHRRCKECHRRYNREHYQTNKEDYRPRYAKRKKRHQEVLKEFIGGWLTSHECVDCGETDIRVLEFDHREKKNFNIAQAVHKCIALRTLKNEISKCEVRCANCHRRKTSIEQGWWKSRYGTRSG